MKQHVKQITGRREFLKHAAGAASLLLGSRAFAASPFPTKPVTLVVPFQAGGLVDVTSRRMAERLTAIWKVPVIVDNRVGASGNIAANFVAQGDADGHTVLITQPEGLEIPSAGRLKLGFDPMEDLAPVALIADVELWLLATPKAPYNTMREFLDYGKKNPGKINMGYLGVGTSQHLGLLQINSASGANIVVPVAYKGVTMVFDLIAGTIDVAFSSRLSTAGHVREKKLKLLGVVGERRSALYPDVSTFAESGLAGAVIPYALGAYVSSKVPADKVAQLNQDIRKVLHEPTLKEKFADDGVLVGNLSPQELRARMVKERNVIEQVFVKNNVKLE